MKAIKLLAAASLAAVLYTTAFAADIVKTNNTDNLDLGSSWVGGVAPSSADIGVWDATVNASNSVLLGADTNWLGMKILNPGGAVTVGAGNTLTLGASGIDMSAATVSLTLDCAVALGVAQPWNIGSGVSLSASGAISGTGPLTKSGAGTLTFSGENTYSGTTVLNAGSLRLSGGANRLPVGTTLSMTGGTLDLNGQNQTIFNISGNSGTVTNTGAAATLTITGGTGVPGIINQVLSGANLTVALATGGGAWNQCVYLSAVNTHAKTIVDNSWLSLGAETGCGATPSSFVADQLTLLNGGTIYNNNSQAALTFSANRGITLGTGGGVFIMGWSKTYTVNGVISGAGTLTTGDSGTLVLTAANTFSGDTINPANLTLKHSLALQNSTLASGSTRLRFDSSVNPHAFTLGGLAGTGTLGLADNAANPIALSVGNNNNSTAYPGTLSGAAGSLIKIGTGTLTLSGANTYGGTTTVSNGTLLVNSPGSLAAGSAVTVQAGGTLGGSGTVNGSVTLAPGATLASGTANLGTLTINNTLTLNGGSTNYMRIKKDGGIAASDRIAGLTGTLTYAGTLVISDVTGDLTALADGDTFTLFSKASGGYAGSFANLVLPALTGTLQWDTSGLAINGIIRVQAPGTTVAPTFSPESGGYIGSLSVTISDTTPGATIYYTMDGTTPTTGSTVYTGPIAVPAPTNLTLKAIATAPGNLPSAVVTASYATMVVPTWISTVNGSWPDTANWSNGVVAIGSGVTADFGVLTLSSNTTITLDGARTIGNLVFGDSGNAFNWTLATGTAGPLTLAGANTPTVTVNNQTTTISAQVAGTNGLVVAGPGILMLSASNSFSGDITVTNGTLVGAVGNGNTPLGAPSNTRTITVSSNAVLNFGAPNIFGAHSTTNVPALVVSGTVVNSSAGTINNALNNLWLNGGTLTATRGNGGWGAWNLNGTVTSTGLSTISAADANSQLVMLMSGETGPFNTLCDVQNGTLTVSARLIDGRSSTSGTPQTTGLTKSGAGVLDLTDASTYSGPTLVSNGTLLVNGSIAAGAVSVQTNGILDGMGTVGGTVTVQNGGTLSGTLSIAGATTVQAGGTLTPGTSTNLGMLLINNTLNLAGTAYFKLDKAYGFVASDAIQGLTGVTYGGTLTVTATGDDLAYGDRVVLFNSAPGSYSGGFTNYNLPPLAAGLSWDKSGLTIDGSITVVNSLGTPVFNPPAGGYVGAQSVTISSDSGSTIYYTTDGTDPTTSVTRLSGSTPVVGLIVPLNTNITIQAYATKSGWTDSPVASANYRTVIRPIWTSLSGGSWHDDNNWLNGVVAPGAGSIADFTTLTLPSDTYVYVDAPAAAGTLLFADVANASTWTLSGSTLTLDAVTNTPAIIVSNTTTTISAPLAGNSGFTKQGAGTLILNGANTYTGTATVSNSVLMLQDPAFSTTAGTYSIAQGAVLTLDGATGIATGTTTLEGAGTLRISGGLFANNVGGGRNLALSLGGTALIDVQAGATLQNGGWQSINWANNLAPLNVNGTLDLWDGNAVRVDALTGSGTVNKSHGTPRTINLTVGVNHGSGVFSGTLTNNSGGGAISLTKVGTGTQTLSGAATYSGATTVSNGTLVVNGSIAADSAVTVETNATLGGIGVVAGSVAVYGTASPGTSVGALNTGPMTLYPGSALKYEVASATNSAERDSVVITGTLDLSALANGPATLKLVSMTNSTTPGLVPDFNGEEDYTWVIATASAGILNFDTSAFAIDATAFVNTHGGVFSVAVQGNSLVVNYTLAPTPPILSGYGPLTGSSFPLTFSGPAGQSYKVLSSTNVALPLSGWTVLSSGTFGPTPVTYTDTSATNAHQFYSITSP